MTHQKGGRHDQNLSRRCLAGTHRASEGRRRLWAEARQKERVGAVVDKSSTPAICGARSPRRTSETQRRGLARARAHRPLHNVLTV